MKWKLPAIVAGVGAAFLALFSSKTQSGGGGGAGGGSTGGEKPPSPNAKAPPWNPPAPGPALAQKEVTGEMTAWAQSLLASPAPMHSLHRRIFGMLPVIGRVEWHTVQARTGKVFPGGLRAVSLYHEGYPDDIG